MSNKAEIILNFAARFCDQASGQTAQAYAVERGWLTEDGSVTDEGKKAAEAFDDQSKTRSALRIG